MNVATHQLFYSIQRCWALFAISTLLCGCQMMMRDDPQLQTIGELLDGNGQNPEKLGFVRNTELESVSADEDVAPVALGYYDNIFDLNAAPGVRFEAMRRAADLRVQAADRGEDMDGQNLAKAVSIYRQLLHDFPDYSDPAQIIYQLARAYQLQGDDESAIQTLHELAYGYPDSERAGDALFRAAEMLFIRGRFPEAAKDYHRVIGMGESSRYWQVAQYKYGWSQYRLGQYEHSITAFIKILLALLPAESTDRLETVLPKVPEHRRELVRDSLRGLSLSFAARSGGPNVRDYFTANGEPVFYPLIYRNLATLLIDKRRYTDAASVYESFAAQHPMHDLSQVYAIEAISAYELGGFVRLSVEAKERYVARYQHESDYWQNRQPGIELASRLYLYMGDIAEHYHALAQEAANTQKRLKQQYFLHAAKWYARILSEFPAQEDSPNINLLYADALFDGGKTLQSAEQYRVTAYDYEGFSRAGDAALAEINAYRSLATEVSKDDRPSVIEKVIGASRKLAEHFPDHPEKNRVLLAAAEDLYTMGDYDAAIAAVQPLVNKGTSLDRPLLRKALSIAADSQFALNRYAQAEALYERLMTCLESNPSLYALAEERRAVAIYRQAEVAREQGDRQRAAKMFMRVAKLSPGVTLRANAFFDAGYLLHEMKNWSGTVDTLESFRKQFPSHPLNADVDKLLADAYSKNGKLAQAARSYARIAGRASESEHTRRSSGLLSAQLFDKVGLSTEAVRSYQFYLAQFPKPLLDAQQVRRRLADMAGSSQKHQHWLRQIIAADDKAGSQVVEGSRQLAARASLELALVDTDKAKSISLSLPLNKSLPRRKRATEAAIHSLNRAAGYGYADITTAASFELGCLYRSLAQALLASERPGGLKGEALEQYLILLEEEVFPFEEKAIEAYEANLQRVRQGLWNDGISKSLTALGDMMPAKYGKQVFVEENYESLY